MKIVRVISLFAFFAGAGVIILPLSFDAAMLFIYQQSHEAITRMHLRFVPDEQFNEKLSIALNEEDIDLANQIVEIGLEYNISFVPELLQRLESENGTWATVSRNSKNALHAAKTGEVTSGYGLAGSVFADLSGASDFRELSRELKAYPDYDSFNVGLSLVGVAGTALTVSSIFNGGATASVGIPMRLGTTAIKGAKTAKRLSKKLQKVFSGQIDNIINKKVVGDLADKFNKIDLDRLDNKQINEFTELAKSAVNFKAAGPLVDSVSDMKVITNYSGVGGLSRSLAAADDLTDLKRLSKLSTATKGKYAGHITLAPKLAKSVYKVLNILIQAIVFLLSALLWLAAAIWYCIKIVRFLFFRSTVAS
ncbi:hypothetical protein [Rheinheimera sp.]|uniref:hypothetical protein n=1 Tax=Rheinheimera sp. TaxID=1869214 RepID=UPI004048418F